MRHSESIKEIATALAKAQGAMANAKKDSDNPFFKAKYADLASVVEAIKKPFSDNGLSYTQFALTNEKDELGVETMLMHVSGEWIAGEPFYVPVTKHDAQGFGSAMTYVRRYSLQAMAGTAAEDDDGNAAAAAKPESKQPRKPAFENGEAHTARGVAVDALAAMPPEQQKFLQEQAVEIMAVFERGENLHDHIEKQRYDTEEKLALWSLLPSQCRTAIKKAQTEAAQKRMMEKATA